MNKSKSIKFRLTPSTEITISAKTNFALPRSLRALCNKSLLKKIFKTPELMMLKFLNAIAKGVVIAHSAQFHPALLLTDGLQGIAEREAYREAVIQHRILMQLKRRRLLEENKMGTKLIYHLTERGKHELFKKQISSLNHNLNNYRDCCVIVFDIPESQKKVRDVFRRFLKECKFHKLQRSVWCTHRDALSHLQEFTSKIGVRKWIRIIETKRIF